MGSKSTTKAGSKPGSKAKKRVKARAKAPLARGAKARSRKTTTRSKARAKPQTIDEYLAGVSDDQRAALQRLRAIVHAAVPGAEECISYQLPAFRMDGKCFLWIGAAAQHCAIYGAVGAEAEALADYDTSGKGTIRFQPDEPLPASLVRKIVKARLARNTAKKRSAPAKAARRR